MNIEEIQAVARAVGKQYARSLFESASEPPEMSFTEDVLVEVCRCAVLLAMLPKPGTTDHPGVQKAVDSFVGH